MLKTIETYSGQTEYLVVDTDGGVWTPDASTQSEIQAAEDRAAVAIAICKSQPLRGTWAS